jgi:TolB-like protein/Tfp pilus assembly protein PilF
MAQKTNSFERFWKELKRRKVIHVITVYAAVAFVILQLVDMVAEPLKLPVSTKALVIVLLSIGFVIAIFLSWVYDITPTGVKKTKPISAVKHTDRTTTPISSGWKIATYVSAIIIVALVAFNFISRRNLSADISRLPKSMAVLPFINDSPDTTNAYFINGIMERITTNLQMIKDFRVIGRTSVEQYRNNKTKSIPEIAKELGVNYIIEGSGQRYGNSFSLVVQFLKAKGKETHLWARTYDQEIKEVNDYIKIESQIAQAITTELKAVISPEEKQLINKISTTSLTADNFYLKGREEYSKYQVDNNNREALERADDLYHKALKYDSTFANAYVGLAMTYLDKHYWESYLSKNLLDSVLILCDSALYYDKQLSDAYTVKGDYYRAGNKTNQALEEYDKAIKINPNDYMAYVGKAYLGTDNDWGMAIYNANKAISIYRGPLLSLYLHGIGDAYISIGFMEKGKNSIDEALKLDGDSVKYYLGLSYLEFCRENFKNATIYVKEAYSGDTNDVQILDRLGESHMFLGQSEESLKYFERLKKESSSLIEGTIFATHRIGWAYKQQGFEREARFYFNEQMNYCKKMIDLGRGTIRQYYDLAAVYASMGDKEKALVNLRIYNQKSYPNLWIRTGIKHDPAFNSIRDEPEYQKIFREYEAKYQAEHERVGKWLEEQGML